MKAGAENHVKFKRLKMRLRLPLWQVKGLLESIWNLTAASAIQGDIGRHSNADIAACIEWEESPDELIDALVETGWLDRCEEHRLVVHDWHEHCPQYIKGNLAKHGKPFASVSAKQTTKQVAKQPARHGATKPILSKPIQNTCANADAFSRFWSAYPKKKSKGAAEKVFNRLKPDGQLLTAMLDAIERSKPSADWMKDGGKFIPYPATWLNARGWEDEQPPADQPSGRRKLEVL